MVNLREKAESELADSRTAKGNAKHNFDMLAQYLNDSQSADVSCPAAEQAAIQTMSTIDFRDASDKCGHTFSEEEEEEWHAQSVAAACSGTKDLVVTAPQCYTGSGGALGLKEDVGVKIDDLGANGAGHMEVAGSGIAAS